MGYRVRASAVVVLIGLAVSGGCSGRHAAVSGRVVEDGQPYQHTGEMVNVLMVGDAHSLSASVQSDGTFKFYGTENKGLVAGRYKIGIASDVESAPGVKKRIKDVSPEKSGMEIELAGGSSATLVIDLVKHTVGK